MGDTSVNSLDKFLTKSWSREVLSLIIGACIIVIVWLFKDPIETVDSSTEVSYIGPIVLFLIIFLSAFAYRNRKAFKGMTSKITSAISAENVDKKRDFLKKLATPLLAVFLVHLILWILGGEWYVSLWSAWPLLKVSVILVIIGIVAQYHRNFAIGLGVLGLIALLLNPDVFDTFRRSETANLRTHALTITGDLADLAPDELVVAEFSTRPVMILVAHCESRLRQFRGDGQVLVRDDRYVGLFQIDTVAHKDLIEETGLDPYRAQDNVQLARILLDKAEGDPMQDWADSSHCWGGEKFPPTDKMIVHKVSIREKGWSDQVDVRKVAFEKWGPNVRIKSIPASLNEKDNLTLKITDESGATVELDSSERKQVTTRNAKWQYRVTDKEKSYRKEVQTIILRISANRPAVPKGTRRAEFFMLAHTCVFLWELITILKDLRCIYTKYAQ